MSLNDSIAAAVAKKDQLFYQDFARFAIRAILAGAYLAIGTGFGVVAGDAVAQYAPALGPVVFALFFGLGLFCIILLGAELATGDMMYFFYGATQRKVSWLKSAGVIVAATLLNLVGVLIVALILGSSAKLSGAGPDHLLVSLTEGKLEKSPGQLLAEGILANFVVNMGVLGSTFAKDVVGKFVVIVPIIAMFVGLGLEHVIANFCLMLTTLFAADPLPDSLTLGAVLTNWGIVWVGNVIGGGLLIGAVYSTLNKGEGAYRD